MQTKSLRTACLILAIALFFVGGILSIAMLAVSLDGDPSVLVIFLPFSGSIIASGVVLLMARKRLALLEGQLAAQDAGQGQSPQQPMPVPTAAADGAAPAPVPYPQPAGTLPGAGNATSQGAQGTPAAQADEVGALVFRSDDVFATLKDLAQHERSLPTATDRRHLAAMLDAAGLLEWHDAPVAEGGRLSRNKHFWLRYDTSNLSEEDYDRFVSVEAALSLDQDLADLHGYDLSERRCLEETLRLMRALCDQEIPAPTLRDEGLACAYDSTAADQTPGEWAVRAALVSAAECASSLFRVVYRVQANLDDDMPVVLIDLEIPRPRCFAIVARDPETQVSLARAYALRLSTYMARHAFASHLRVGRVVVNCHERNASCCLSLDVSSVMLGQLIALARSSKLEEGFPADDGIRVEFDQQGWLSPTITPFLEADALEVFPLARRSFPELVHTPTPQALRQASGAATIADLGINENAGRVSAWNALSEHLGSTTEQAVQALVQARNEADDITVAEACSRLMQELVEGHAELDDRGQLSRIFIDGSALDQAVMRANSLLDDGNEDPEAAARILTEALAPIDEMGGYLDDADTVYRYFGSVPERIRHNLHVNEGGRRISLVPDAYFNAHAQLSVALDLLGQSDEAFAHAERCVHLAPTSTYAVMRKVRVLEHQSRVFEAADLIRQNLSFATTPRDAAICHYRLAYMEWKLGREDIAVPCYQRALTWDTEVRTSAQEELEDLLSSNPHLKALETTQVTEALLRAGIPLGCDEEARTSTLAAAVTCIDANAFYSAAPLLGSLFSMESDDVVMGVYRSLAPWR